MHFNFNLKDKWYNLPNNAMYNCSRMELWKLKRTGAEKCSCLSHFGASLHNLDWCAGVVVQVMEWGSMGWNCLQLMEGGLSLLLCTRSTYRSLNLYSTFSFSISPILLYFISLFYKALVCFGVWRLPLNCRVLSV